MEEIWDLQAQFERAQAVEVIQRLSERNCVEIILKLIESGRVKLLFSSTGKEFLTPARLRGEILSEVRSHGGRISITDLPDLLNVDLANIERTTSEISSGSSMFLVNGQMISKSYIDNMCSEITESVLESGMVTLAALSQQFALPVGLIQSELDTRLQLLGQKFNCQLYLQNQKLYTDLYATTHNAKIRGLLFGCTRPVSLQSLVSRHGLQEKLVKSWIKDMEDTLPGTISGVTNNLGMFTPWVYVRAQQSHISAIYTQNNFVELSNLHGTGLSKPLQYLSGLFPDGILLQRIFINPVLLQSVESAISDVLSSNTWLDVRTILPSSLLADDMASIVKKAEESPLLRKCSKQYHHLEKVYVVSSVFIKSCATSLNTFISELGTQAAIVMHQKSKQPIPIVEDVDAKVSKSKKDRSKKRSSGTTNDALSRHIRPSLDLDPVKDALISAFPDCDIPLIGGIISIITPSLRIQFEKIRDSPHIISDESQAGVDISELRRKRIKYWIQYIHGLAESFQAFSAANNELSNFMDDMMPLEQYLISTIGLELSDGLIRLNVYLNNSDYAAEDKSGLDDEQRQKLLAMLSSGSSQSIMALSLLKSSADFFVQFKSLATECDLQIKDAPKKKLKQIGFTMKARLGQQLLTEQRPEAVLLSTTILLFYRVFGMILHAPFTSVDNLLEALYKSKIPREMTDQVQALKTEIASPTDKLNSCIESVRTMISSEPKTQENV